MKEQGNPEAMASMYVTVPDLDAARAISHALVRDSLAACVNIIPGMHSFYRWRGNVEEAEECVLFVKTSAVLAERAIAAVVAMHPYETPCVVVLPVTDAFDGYRKWVLAEVRAPETSPGGDQRA